MDCKNRKIRQVSRIIFLWYMQNLKAIIFDLGGVLLNLDFTKTSTAFKEIGVIDIDEMYSQHTIVSLFKDLETGRINEHDFYEGIKTSGKNEITDEQIRNAWNALLLDFRNESMAALKNLKTKYKLFLLSNTNIIHLQAFNKIYETSMIGGTFTEHFDKVYFSHEIACRKPDAEAYEIVLNENNLIALETLFIDDSAANIEGAKAVGLQTILLKDGMKIEDLNL
jgi:glucose-1-phosphatase